MAGDRLVYHVRKLEVLPEVVFGTQFLEVMSEWESIDVAFTESQSKAAHPAKSM